MTNKWMRSAVLAISCSALALTASCGTERGGGSQQTVTTQKQNSGALPDVQDRAKWPSPEVESGLAAGMRLPLEEYMLGFPDEVEVENARDKVKRECMADLGFTFAPPASGNTPALSYDSMNMKRRYGVTDTTTARTYGYQPPIAAEAADDTAAEEAAEGRDDAWFKALDTCVSEANDRVGILYETDIAGDLAAESLEATASNLEVLAALDKWRACMSRANFAAGTSPQQAGETFTQSTATEPTEAEKDMAATDVACKQSSNLVNKWYQAETAFQNTQISKHGAELAAEKGRNTAMVATARAILGQ